MGKLVAGIVFICVGIFFIIAAWGGHFQNKKIMNEGGRAVGRVYDKKTSHYRTGARHHRRSHTDYKVFYSFNTKNEETIESRYAVSKDKWDSLKIGDAIEIAYDFNKPEHNLLIGEEALTSIVMPVLFSFFSLIPIAIGSLFATGFIETLKAGKNKSPGI